MNGSGPMIALDLRDCYGLVVASERRRNATYDLVVKLRPDEQICKPLPTTARAQAGGLFGTRPQSETGVCHVRLRPEPNGTDEMYKKN